MLSNDACDLEIITDFFFFFAEQLYILTLKNITAALRTINLTIPANKSHIPI